MIKKTRLNIKATVVRLLYFFVSSFAIAIIESISPTRGNMTLNTAAKITKVFNSIEDLVLFEELIGVISLFLASVGLTAGGTFVDSLVSGNGLLYVGIGFVITFVH